MVNYSQIHKAQQTVNLLVKKQKIEEGANLRACPQRPKALPPFPTMLETKPFNTQAFGGHSSLKLLQMHVGPNLAAFHPRPTNDFPAHFPF